MEAYMKNSGVYDAAKWFALIVLPASGALYFGLAQIWGLPNAEEVVGTVTVVETFLGVLVGISKKAYDSSDAKYDGAINVTETQGTPTWGFEFKTDPMELAKKPDVNLKIVSPGEDSPVDKNA